MSGFPPFSLPPLCSNFPLKFPFYSHFSLDCIFRWYFSLFLSILPYVSFTCQEHEGR